MKARIRTMQDREHEQLENEVLRLSKLWLFSLFIQRKRQKMETILINEKEGIVMRTQLKINGELKDVEIENGEITVIEPEKKQTGWERAKKGTGYTCISLGAGLCPEIDSYFAPDNVAFRTANYFTNDKLAENINRMQTLQRKMFRWQAENDEPINFNDCQQVKYEIYYCHRDGTFGIRDIYACTYGFTPYFSTREKAEECTGAFKDELTWLFTEFKWRMDG